MAPIGPVQVLTLIMLLACDFSIEIVLLRVAIMMNLL